MVYQMRDALASLPIPPRLLSALLLLLGAMMAPHAANLSPAILGFFYAAVVWRLLAQRRPGWMPGRWLLFFLMVAALALVVVTTGLYDGRLAGTALLVVMLGLKLLELRARRDIHLTVFLGYFLVLTQFLYDQSLWLAAYLFAAVLALTAIQVGLNRVEVQLRAQLRYTAVMLAAAVPLALVVFLLFPRLQTPLWGINRAGATTGISDEMTLGNIGSLSRSTATAFRVRFLDRVPEPPQRYWRGPVLWQTDGARWSAGHVPVRSLREPGVDLQSSIGYELTLEPTGEYWLFGLDVVAEGPPASHLNSNYALVGDQRVSRRLTYRASSDPGYRMLSISAEERRRSLQLPERISPRVIALVAKWQGQTNPGQPLQLVSRALDYFRTQPFVYTLSPGILDGDAMEQFLFETRRGFCEHYAGSFALLMRIAGIPSRVVLGYQGGEPNPHSDHWVVRQADAHAWTEIWLPDLGWWRVDPTAAVAPERIEQSIDTTLSQGADRVVFSVDGQGLLGGVWQDAAWLADAVDLGWHRWVVGFTAERQNGLLQMFGVRKLEGFGLAIALLAGSGLAITFVYLVARLPRPRRIDPLPVLWQGFLRKVHRAGVQTAPWQGPDTVCTLATKTFPDASRQLSAINRMYVQLRYGRQSDPQQIRALRRHIRELDLR